MGATTVVRTKGAHVINAVKMLRGDKERARALLAPALHKYLEERILPSSWYPFEDQRALWYAVVELMGGLDAGIWIAMGRGVARMDMNGLYKRHLKPGDPEGSLRLLAAMWKNAYDAGELQVSIVEPGRGAVTLVGFPGREDDICGICTGYLTEVVTMAAGVEPEVVQERCRARRDRDCAWTVRWRARAGQRPA